VEKVSNVIMQVTKISGVLMMACSSRYLSQSSCCWRQQPANQEGMCPSHSSQDWDMDPRDIGETEVLHCKFYLRQDWAEAPGCLEAAWRPRHRNWEHISG